jgi:hypothetical protein
MYNKFEDSLSARTDSDEETNIVSKEGNEAVNIDFAPVRERGRGGGGKSHLTCVSSDENYVGQLSC